VFDKLKAFVLARTPGKSDVFHFDPSLKPVDRKFVETVARDLGMGSSIEYSNEDDTKHIYVEFESDDEDDTDEYETDDEALAARDRVLNKYDNAPVVAELSNEEIEQEEKNRADQRFKKWRADYYMVRHYTHHQRCRHCMVTNYTGTRLFFLRRKWTSISTTNSKWMD
jgi:hypothetical protein